MLSDEMKKKLSEIPEEKPDDIDLQMLREASVENAGSEGTDMEEYFA